MSHSVRLFGAALLVVGAVNATEVRDFPDPAQRERYEALVQDLRCLVCQNQSLADSDADLARDLRDEVYQIIRSGKTDQEAVSFLVDRYGDFVLYRPPLKATTLLLWIGPLLLLAGGLFAAWRRARDRAGEPREELSAEQRRRLDELKRRIEE